MLEFLKILLLAVMLVGLAWAAIAIKMFVSKNGRFTRNCGSVDPVSGKPIPCSCEMNKPSTCENK